MLKERRKYYSKPAFLFYIQQKKKKMNGRMNIQEGIEQ
jgi:hypothetical protein